MNHVVAAAAGLVLDQPSFFSTLLKKLILMHRHWAGDFMAGYQMAGDFWPGAHLSG